MKIGEKIYLNLNNRFLDIQCEILQIKEDRKMVLLKHGNETFYLTFENYYLAGGK
jgi:hypothetical protein